MSFECQFCNKTYSAKHNLILHQKTAKFCLKIQQRKEENEETKQDDIKKQSEDEKDEMKLVCEYCNLDFKLKHHLLRHQDRCREKIKKFEKENNNKKEELLNTIQDENEKLKRENYQLSTELNKLITELTILKNDLKNEKNICDQIKVEKDNLLKQLIELKSIPTINTTTNNNNYNSSQSNSTKVANICTINNKLPLTKEFFNKIGENIDFINEKFRDEKDICRYTLKQGLNQFVLVVDKSRRVLTFTDEKGNTIRDQNGIQLAKQLYSELCNRLEGVEEHLAEQKDDEEYFVPTTLDQRKKIVNLIKTKNIDSMERFGKAYFNEYSKFDDPQLLSKDTPQLIQQERPPSPVKENFNHEYFSIFKSKVKNIFYKSNFNLLSYGLHTIGGFLQQFMNELDFEISEDMELIVPDDSENMVTVTSEQFFTILINIFTEEDFIQICTKNNTTEYLKNAIIFNRIFIMKNERNEVLIEDIYKGITNNIEY